MGKAKASKSGDGVPQKHLHSRISYLHQAATYLAYSLDAKNSVGFARSQRKHRGLQTNQTNHLLSQLQGVSKKSQIRLARNVKHSLCKRCDALLIMGLTSSERVINSSTGERKPGADVFETECRTCGTVKRLPVGQELIKAKAKSDDREIAQRKSPKEVAEHVVK